MIFYIKPFPVFPTLQLKNIHCQGEINFCCEGTKCMWSNDGRDFPGQVKRDHIVPGVRRLECFRFNCMESILFYQSTPTRKRRSKKTRPNVLTSQNPCRGTAVSMLPKTEAYILKAKKFAEPLFQSKKFAEKVRKSGRHFWAILGHFWATLDHFESF